MSLLFFSVSPHRVFPYHLHHGILKGDMVVFDPYLFPRLSSSTCYHAPFPVTVTALVPVFV